MDEKPLTGAAYDGYGDSSIPEVDTVVNDEEDLDGNDFDAPEEN